MGSIQIPVIEQRRVQESGLPDYRQNLKTSPEDFGSDIAQGIAQAGKVVTDIAQQEREKQDRAVKMSAWVRVQEAVQRREEELKAVRGINAVAAGHKQFEDSLGQDLSEVHKTIPNRLKADVGDMIAKAQLQFRDTAVGHVNSQSDFVADERFKGATAMASQMAARYAAVGRLGDSDDAIGVGEQAIAAFHSGRGSPEASIDATMVSFKTKAVDGVVGQLISSGSTDAARLYLKKYRSGMDQEVVLGLDKRIENESVKQWAFGEAAGLQDKFTTDRGFAFDTEKAEQQARILSGENAAKYDALMDRVKDIESLKETHRKQSDSPNLTSINTMVHSNKSWGTIEASTEYQNTSQEGQRTARDWFEAKQGSGSEQQNKKDTMLYYRFMRQPDSKQFEMDVDTDPITRGASEQTRERMKVVQKTLNESGVNLPTVMAQVNDFISKKQISSKPPQKGLPSDAERIRIGIRERYVNIKNQPDKKGMNPSSDEISAMLDDELSDVIKETPWYQRDAVKPKILLTEKEKPQFRTKGQAPTGDMVKTDTRGLPVLPSLKSGLVDVINADGQKGKIPRERLEDFIKAGGKAL
jgi:hypothetical protein